MSGDFHRDGLSYARPIHVAYRRTTKVVKQQPDDASLGKDNNRDRRT
jgi:hypothetical protein